MNDIKILLRDKIISLYHRYSNPKCIQVIIRNGFNYDIDIDSNAQNNSRFYSDMVSITINCILLSIQLYASYIYWNDIEMIPYVGNYFISTGFPKDIIIFFFSCALLSMVKLIISYRILSKDPNLILSMDLISTISRSGDHGSIDDIDDIEKIRNQLGPYILIIRVINFSYFICLFLTIFAFFMISLQSISFTNISLCVFWSISASALVSQYTWRSSALVITMLSILKLYELSLRMHSENIEHSDQDRGIFFEKISMGVKSIDSIRKYNQFLKLIIGFDMIIMLVVTTTGIFMLITVDFILIHSFIIPLLTVVYFLLYVYILIPSKISDQLRSKRKHLVRMSNKCELSIIERYRVNIVLEGMRHHDTFSIFDHFPIQRMLILTVSFLHQ